MGYELGIDFGTTFTAAAVYRDGRAEVVTLGYNTPSVASVLFVKEDSSILTGDAATRRGLAEPRRFASEFKRRIGDPTPLLLGEAPYAAEALMAKMLRWTADAVAQQEGEEPDGVAVTFPANWGPFKRELLTQAIRLASLEGVLTISEPEAAATYYASKERLEPGAVVAVYDLGGGTFDAAVLRKTETGFEILGTPEGIEHLGGIDFDEAVLAHVDRALDGKVAELDPADPVARQAMTMLRQEVVEAKEGLSADTDVSIPVALPNVHTGVRLTRGEFEAMIRPPLAETIASLRRALKSAGVEPGGVSAVLLVGGSSRIPLVAKMVSAELGRPVAVDAHPKHAVVLGAAIAAHTARSVREPATASVPDGAVPGPLAIDAPPEAPPRPTVPPPERVATSEPRRSARAAKTITPPEPPPAPKARRRLPRRLLIGGVALALIAGLVVGGLFLFRKEPTGFGGDPRDVAVETLLRPGTVAVSGGVVYGELDGTIPEEIVVVSEEQEPAESLYAQSFVDVFGWDFELQQWVKRFDARTFDSSGPNGDFPSKILVNERRAEVDQSVSFVRAVDFLGDGISELVLGVQATAGTSGPLEVWILSLFGGDLLDEASFFTSTEVGGELAVGADGSSLVLTSGKYAARDPGCCPSLRLRQVIDWDDVAGGFRVVKETEKPAGE